MPSLKNAEVISSDGKKIGKVQDENDRYLIVFKKGLLMDEKLRVPIESISEVKNMPQDENSESLPSITLNVTEESLKHAHEFIEGKPNSEFMHGRIESEPKFKLEKQVIYHEPPTPADKDESLVRGTSSPPPVDEKHQAAVPNNPEKQYACDMCSETFMQPDDMQKHRARVHKAPTNI